MKQKTAFWMVCLLVTGIISNPLYAQEQNSVIAENEQSTDMAVNDLYLADEEVGVSFDYYEPEILVETEENTVNDPMQIEEETLWAGDSKTEVFDGLLSFEEEPDELLQDGFDPYEEQLSGELETTDQDPGSFVETEISADALFGDSEDEDVLYSGTYGANLTWKLTGTEEAMTLTISGKGNMSEKERPWFSYKDNIVEVIIEEGVTSIRYQAFEDCSALTSVSLPDSLTKINGGAFGNCTSLKRITLPPNLTSLGYSAFRSCEQLVDVKLPAALTELGSGCFSGCSSLRELEIPQNITWIVSSLFNGCTSLEEVSIPETVSNIHGAAFKGCTALKTVYFSGSRSQWLDNIRFADGNSYLLFANVVCSTDDADPDIVVRGTYSGGAGWEIIRDNKAYVLKCSVKKNGKIDGDSDVHKYRNRISRLIINDGITYLGSGAFRDLQKLKSVSFPDGITYVGRYCFENCIRLKTIDLPDSITQIDDSAFKGCNSLHKLSLPAGLKTVGNNVFQDCISLSSVRFTNAIQNIGNYAFSGCSSLNSVRFPYYMEMNSIGRDAFEGCIELNQVELPAVVKNLGFEVFKNCINLTGLTIPGVYSDGYNKVFFFSGCSALTTIAIPYGYCWIYDGAMENCSSLRSVSIPASVNQIGESAFAGCGALTDVYFGGSEQLWKNILIGDGNMCLKKARIHYKDKSSLSSAEIILSRKVIAYSGEYLKPEVTVMLSKETLKEGTDYTVTYKNNKKVGIAIVKITGTGRCSGSVSTTFRIRPRRAVIRNLSGAKRSFSVTWSKRIRQNSGYLIQYSLYKDFPSRSYKRFNVWVHDPNTVSTVVKGLESGKVYYVRIHCFKDVDGTRYFSKWSDVGTVKTK